MVWHKGPKRRPLPHGGASAFAQWGYVCAMPTESVPGVGVNLGAWLFFPGERGEGALQRERNEKHNTWGSLKQYYFHRGRGERLRKAIAVFPQKKAQLAGVPASALGAPQQWWITQEKS